MILPEEHHPNQDKTDESGSYGIFVTKILRKCYVATIAKQA